MSDFKEDAVEQQKLGSVTWDISGDVPDKFFSNKYLDEK